MKLCLLQYYLQVRTWTQPKCPLTDELIKKLIHVNTMKYYSMTTKNEIMSFTITWMDLKIIAIEVGQTEKDTAYNIIHM